MKYFALTLFLIISNAIYAANEVPDTMAERVKACTICHGDEDRAGRDAYYPRIASKPQGYLYNQLRNFRDGRRHYQPMAILLENMTDEYLQEIAQHFAALQLPFPPPEKFNMQPEEITLVKTLVEKGVPERDIPACGACHGDNLMGIAPYIPGLLGLSRAYITAQLGGWRNGGLVRGQTPDCMSEIAKQLTDGEANAIAKWLASQPAVGQQNPFSTLSSDLAHR
ncbi:MAG: cytochrome c4, partial [Nitrosomonas sp.]|nr:cytochrome c4 [Nitrosomonas sp.]